MAPLVRTGGSRHTGLAALPHRNIHLSAAIFMSGVNTWDATLFAAGLSYVGPVLSIASFVALIVGILFLGYGVYEEIRKNKK